MNNFYIKVPFINRTHEKMSSNSNCVYFVQPGDTFDSIARSLNSIGSTIVTRQSLIGANPNISAPLIIGAPIYIPDCGSTKPDTCIRLLNEVKKVLPSGAQATIGYILPNGFNILVPALIVVAGTFPGVPPVSRGLYHPLSITTSLNYNMYSLDMIEDWITSRLGGTPNYNCAATLTYNSIGDSIRCTNLYTQFSRDFGAEDGTIVGVRDNGLVLKFTSSGLISPAWLFPLIDSGRAQLDLYQVANIVRYTYIVPYELYMNVIVSRGVQVCNPTYTPMVVISNRETYVNNSMSDVSGMQFSPISRLNAANRAAVTDIGMQSINRNIGMQSTNRATVTDIGMQSTNRATVTDIGIQSTNRATVTDIGIQSTTSMTCNNLIELITPIVLASTTLSPTIELGLVRGKAHRSIGSYNPAQYIAGAVIIRGVSGIYPFTDKDVDGVCLIPLSMDVYDIVHPVGVDATNSTIYDLTSVAAYLGDTDCASTITDDYNSFCGTVIRYLDDIVASKKTTIGADYSGLYLRKVLGPASIVPRWIHVIGGYVIDKVVKVPLANITSYIAGRGEQPCTYRPDQVNTGDTQDGSDIVEVLVNGQINMCQATMDGNGNVTGYSNCQPFLSGMQ